MHPVVSVTGGDKPCLLDISDLPRTRSADFRPPLNLGQERTIEVEERGEEADIAKEARVTEELVVTKDVDERTEDVSDTVRHTEVEVEDERDHTRTPERRRARR